MYRYNVNDHLVISIVIEIIFFIRLCISRECRLVWVRAWVLGQEEVCFFYCVGF